MAELYYPREATFMDSQADVRVEGSGVYDVPDELEAFYRSRGWEDVPEDFDGDAEQVGRVQSRNATGPTRDELVGDSDGGENDQGDSSSGDEAEAEADGFDADAFVRDGNAEDVADAIAAGDADGHLSEVRAAEDDYRGRTTVNDALDDRDTE